MMTTMMMMIIDDHDYDHQTLQRQGALSQS